MELSRAVACGFSEKIVFTYTHTAHPPPPVRRNTVLITWTNLYRSKSFMGDPTETWLRLLSHFEHSLFLLGEPVSLFS